MQNNITVGLDLGDKRHVAVVMDAKGDEICVSKFTNSKPALERFISQYPQATVAIEAGTHSPWISRFLEGLGCQVYVGNPRQLALIWNSDDKSDEKDARILAMVCRLEPRLLRAIQHRSLQAHCDLAVIKSREMLVESRTKLINHVRGTLKAVGERLPKCSAASFAKHTADLIPGSLRPAIDPLMQQIASKTEQIAQLDRKIAQLSEQRYPESERLKQVPGVGPVTALTFVLTIEDPSRFDRSRQVGKFLGLTPRGDQSGETNKQLPINKAGNGYLRKLLISCAQHIIGPFGADSDLKRFGMRKAAGGGKNAKKRAVTAVGRKLAVLLHRLWVSGETYQPFYNQRFRKAA